MPNIHLAKIYNPTKFIGFHGSRNGYLAIPIASKYDGINYNPQLGPGLYVTDELDVAVYYAARGLEKEELWKANYYEVYVDPEVFKNYKKMIVDRIQEDVTFPFYVGFKNQNYFMEKLCGTRSSPIDYIRIAELHHNFNQQILIPEHFWKTYPGALRVVMRTIEIPRNINDDLELQDYYLEKYGSSPDIYRKARNDPEWNISCDISSVVDKITEKTEAPAGKRNEYIWSKRSDLNNSTVVVKNKRAKIMDRETRKRLGALYSHMSPEFGSDRPYWDGVFVRENKCIASQGRKYSCHFTDNLLKNWELCNETPAPPMAINAFQSPKPLWCEKSLVSGMYGKFAFYDTSCPIMELVGTDWYKWDQYSTGKCSGGQQLITLRLKYSWTNTYTKQNGRKTYESRDDWGNAGTCQANLGDRVLDYFHENRRYTPAVYNSWGSCYGEFTVPCLN
jgi:hypothetical protein